MKTSVFIATSLDGFIARMDGSLDWLPGSAEEIGFEDDNSEDEMQSELEDYGYNSFFESVDTLVMGRNTYETVLSFGQWPYEKKRVIVMSSTLKKVADYLPDTVELSSLSSMELYEMLLGLGARHLYIDGGKTIQGFLRENLIDEMTITRVPILIGSGIPLFGPLSHDIKLNHIETTSYKNGLVQSKYYVKRNT